MINRWGDNVIKLSYDMKVYRQHLREVLEKTDNVVELGAHVGKSSEISFQDTMIILPSSVEM